MRVLRLTSLTFAVGLLCTLGNLHCNSGAKEQAPIQAPSGLSYSSSTGSFTVGVAIPPMLPSLLGGAPNSFAVLPALPAGLSLSPTLGTITGTPTLATPTATYTVTAANSTGNASATLTLTVNDPAPTGLTYATSTAVYTVGQAISANAPTLAGGAAGSFTVAPPLPAGLSLDAASGSITGTPTAVTATASYTVTAQSATGAITATLTLTVKDAAPTGLTYATSTAVYTVGVAIPANAPTHTGGAVGSYTVAPALPAGLSLNAATGSITGTPTAATATAS